MPNLVLKGRSFFHRSEIMLGESSRTILPLAIASDSFACRLAFRPLVLAYLQLIDNENFGSAFERAINAPHRGVGAAVSSLPQTRPLSAD